MQLSLHPRQAEVLLSPATEILFGGAAGPGKSHLLRVAAIIWCNDIPGLQVYLIRRTYPELMSNHMEGPKSLRALLAPWVELKKVKIADNDIRFLHNGSAIHLRHCQYEQDMYSFQGSEIHCLMIDELTSFTSTIYEFLRSRVRMTGMTVPERWKGRFPRIVCGSNPGNIGHNWVKAAFIDPGTNIHKTSEAEGGMLRQFIPAVMEDNPDLIRDDPGYRGRLHGLNDKALVRAMEFGDWDMVAGGAISDLWDRKRHVIPPFPIPRDWYVDRSFDWGSSRPFSLGWWAESDGSPATLPGNHQKTWPKGTLFRIAEWYGWTGKPDEGCRLEDTEIGKGMKEREASIRENLKVRRIHPGPADGMIFETQPGKPSIAQGIEQGYGKQDLFYPADKRPGSRIKRLAIFRRLLSASGEEPMELPGIFFFDTCVHGAIRTIPTLPRDIRNAEDIDTRAEDHAWDDIGYRITTARRLTSSIRVEAA
jgi:hypothetical protein